MDSVDQYIPSDPPPEEQFWTALATDDWDLLADLLREQPIDVTKSFFDTLNISQQREVLETLKTHISPELILSLPTQLQEYVLDLYTVDEIAALIAQMESDDAFAMVELLDEPIQKALFKKITPLVREHLERALSAPEGTALRLMQQEVVAVPAFWTVGQIIQYIQESDTLPPTFHEIYVVDARHRPVGMVPLNKLLQHKPYEKILELCEEQDLVVIPASDTNNEVAAAFSLHGLLAAPVVDHNGRLIGMITADDIVDIINENSEQELVQIAGVNLAELQQPFLITSYSRLMWLLITFLSAIGMGAVVNLFQDSLEQMVILAVLMPIVPSLSGSAAIQTLTVAVRAIATQELTGNNIRRTLKKELLVGLVNALVFGLLCILLAWMWTGVPQVGLILAAAMAFNLLWAAVMGVSLPLLVHRFGIDPAVCSGPLVSATTDVLGVLVFLGMATWYFF